MTSHNPLIRAWLSSLRSGYIEYARDWGKTDVPALRLRGGPSVLATPLFAELEPAPRHAAARRYGYFVREDGALVFALPSEMVPEGERVYVSGDFNRWRPGGDPLWELQAGIGSLEIAGPSVPPSQAGDALVTSAVPPAKVAANGAPEAGLGTGLHELEPDLRPLVCCVVPLARRRAVMRRLRDGRRGQFKFVTGEQQWLNVPEDSPNRIEDAQGHFNYEIDPKRTGRQFFKFTLREPLDLSQEWRVAPLALLQAEVGDAKGAAPVGVLLQPGKFFFSLGSELPLGAVVLGEGAQQRTRFRLFAPRASSVRVLFGDSADPHAPAEVVPLARHAREPYVWEASVEGNLHGQYYWYQLSGEVGVGNMDRTTRVLDPYALACVGREGPGIVIDAARIGRRHHDPFITPQWQDLVIAEAHVRDLAAHAPLALRAEERLGFTGLRKWVEHEDFYLHRLGINCVELQPVQEFDNRTREEYHWGYMTVNWFAPASAYALDPARASGIAELQALVAAFHRRGIAVILDVVYNHQGEPAGLTLIDREYYFEHNADGELSNWSGCGNDIRARSAMAKRLIIDSCRHMIECFGVDGFRFDLAELLGAEVLREIELALKQTKPDVILIAEPWSYRGHIAGVLRDTGWSSWNDGYRNFARDYVRGGSSQETFEYFIKGSPWFWAKWPAQTLNYSESHDDRAWIDVITENAGHDGRYPTPNDRRRTHLMAALLFASLGIPMIAAGQDFLRSKGGVNNTYQRGDLNALDYRRLLRYPATHAYFADWIAFRRSEAGRLLRQWKRPSESFFRFYPAPHSTACAVVYNFDASQGRQRLLFAINPTGTEVEIPLGEALPTAARWEQLANHESFLSGHGMRQPVTSQLWLPPLSCGLWQGSL